MTVLSYNKYLSILELADRYLTNNIVNSFPIELC